MARTGCPHWDCAHTRLAVDRRNPKFDYEANEIRWPVCCTECGAMGWARSVPGETPTHLATEEGGTIFAAREN